MSCCLSHHNFTFDSNDWLTLQNISTFDIHNIHMIMSNANKNKNYSHHNNSFVPIHNHILLLNIIIITKY